MYRVPDVAAHLRISVASVYQLLTSGKLGCYRVGRGRGVYRISEDHLARYLAGTEPVRPAPRPATPALKHLRG